MENKELIYPIKFIPILQQKIWGGNKLVTEFNKESDLSNIGESWELSGVENFVSIVANGNLAGKTLTELIETHKGDFVGEKVYKNFGNEFPLLFKFIDASDDLSIQLHPNDELAKIRHNSFGKTEMWYVLSADENARLYAGFSKKMDREIYLNHFNKGEILDVIHVDEVKKGDAFFIEVGTIHAIGKGILIAEIQQTSNITYRIYDWDRVDAQGNGRELYTDLALDALDFSKIGTCKLTYEHQENTSNQIYSCQYFTTNKLNITQEINRNISNNDSFIVYMCVEGEGSVFVGGNNENLQKGETVLIPAKSDQVFLKPTSNDFQLLEIYIK